MKPFNLTAALNGEPVMLRNGHKAFVKYTVPDEYQCMYPLQGFIVRGKYAVSTEWTDEGKMFYARGDEGFDIVGMWEEPAETVSINGHEFPKPYRGSMEKGSKYWLVRSEHEFVAVWDVWGNSAWDDNRKDLGLVHLTQEAAEQHAAVLNAVHKEMSNAAYQEVKTTQLFQKAERVLTKKMDEYLQEQSQ